MVSFQQISDNADARGAKFAVPWPEPARIAEVHFAEILPGAVRGNHFHRQRFETLVVFGAGHWSLWFDSGEGTTVESRSFGAGDAVVVRIEPLSAHAIRNEGSTPLWICSMGDTADEPGQPDTFRRVLV